MGSSEENTTISPKLIAGLVSGCDLESSKTLSLSFAPKKRGYVCFEKTFSPVHLLVWAAAARKSVKPLLDPRYLATRTKVEEREEKSFFANFPFPLLPPPFSPEGKAGGGNFRASAAAAKIHPTRRFPHSKEEPSSNRAANHIFPFRMPVESEKTC